MGGDKSISMVAGQPGSFGSAPASCDVSLPFSLNGHKAQRPGYEKTVCLSFKAAPLTRARNTTWEPAV